MGRLRPMIMEATVASRMARILEPPLADMMSPEILSPRPVRVNVPTIKPAAAKSIATGSTFFPPSITASTIFTGVSHSLRSLLRKLVSTVVPRAPRAAYSGDLFQTANSRTSITREIR